MLANLATHENKAPGHVATCSCKSSGCEKKRLGLVVGDIEELVVERIDLVVGAETAVPVGK
eukprot:12221110-Heterocapsa_arctica.AAC.1